MDVTALGPYALLIGGVLLVSLQILKTILEIIQSSKRKDARRSSSQREDS